MRAIESLLAFWADAGVEALYGDTPVDRAPSTATPRPNEPASTPTKLEPRPPEVAARAAPVPGAPAHELASVAPDLGALAVQAAAAAGAGWNGYCFHRGDPEAIVVVVVDAPDDDDHREGRPATGAKGRLLDRMLASVALEGRTLVLNAALQRGADGRGASDPASFMPFVARALVLVRPCAVVAAGATAARLFFPSDQPIPRLRGRWTAYVAPGLDAPTPVLATFSPSLLLAQPAAKKLAWRDIMTLQQRLEADGAFGLA